MIYTMQDYSVNKSIAFERMDIEVKKHIKAFSAICSLAMVFSIFSTTVTADETITTVDQDYITANDGYLPKTSGNYKLESDILVDKSTQIEEDGAQISIDLNGHTITYTTNTNSLYDGSMYVIGKVEGLTVKAGNIQLTVSNGFITTDDNYKGTGSTDHWISNNRENAKSGTDANRGGCFLIQYSSTLTLNDVNISRFHAGDEGGAICISNGSSLNMNGGKIENCTSEKGGGAISVNAAQAASVTSNGVTYNLHGVATLSGTKILNNYAESLGGGIRSNRASIILSDCEISGNTCKNGKKTSANGGGGIQFLKYPSNGQVIKIKGNMQIIGNTCIETPGRSNFFLDGGKSIDLFGDLDPDARIAFGAISESTSPDYFKVGNYAYSLDNFLCDNSEYVPVYYANNKSIRMAQATAPSFDSMNVSIAGNIALNVRLDLGSFANNNTTVSYEYSYDKSGVTKNVSKKLQFSDLTKDGNYYTFSIPVESACMTAPITMSINYGVDGKVTPANEITIEDYANQIMSGQYAEIAKALLTFGGYAQVQLGINTDQLPTVSGVDFHSTFANALTAETYTSPVTGYAASALSLLSETEIKMYFSKATLGDTAPSMTVNYGSSSETVTATTSGNYYVYTIKGPSGSGFAATQFDSEFTYTIGNESGTYSVYTYLKLAKAKGAADLINLAEAYYNFAQQCKLVA